MPDTTDQLAGITGETPLMRFKRDTVFAAAKRKGAETHEQRMALMGLSRATYFRALRGAHIRLETATRAARALGLTVDKAFEAVPDAEVVPDAA